MRSLGLVMALAAVGTLVFTGLRRGDVDSAGAARVASLREQVALASEGRVYFVLDPAERTLTLYSGASPLRAWPVERVQVGSRRLRIPNPGLDASWSGRNAEHPRLDPPVVRERRTIVSDSVEAPDLTGADEWIPPLPEEAIPAPTRFVVHYDGGLGVEIVQRDEPDGIHPLRTAIRVLGALAPGLDRYRVRVTMDAADVGALYRTYPTDAAFLIRIPEIR